MNVCLPVTVSVTPSKTTTLLLSFDVSVEPIVVLDLISTAPLTTVNVPVTSAVVADAVVTSTRVVKSVPSATSGIVYVAS